MAVMIYMYDFQFCSHNVYSQSDPLFKENGEKKKKCNHLKSGNTAIINASDEFNKMKLNDVSGCETSHHLEVFNLDKTRS